MQGFGDTVSRGLRQIAFLLAPTAVVSAVLAEPIIRILYQRGAWSPGQTPVVAAALAAFSAGLVFNGAMLMLNRAFFSLQENWFPTAVALGNLALNALLDLAFYRFGTWGIPLATAVSNVFATAALLVLLRRRLGRIGGGAITFSLLKIIAASAVVALLSYAVWRPLDEALGRSFPAQAVSLGLALAVATAGYLAACRALRVREMQALLSLRGRFARS
jgi:putative peptidoglycan lipid II flippase